MILSTLSNASNWTQLFKLHIYPIGMSATSQTTNPMDIDEAEHPRNSLLKKLANLNKISVHANNELANGIFLAF